MSGRMRNTTKSFITANNTVISSLGSVHQRQWFVLSLSSWLSHANNSSLVETRCLVSHVYCRECFLHDVHIFIRDERSLGWSGRWLARSRPCNYLPASYRCRPCFSIIEAEQLNYDMCSAVFFPLILVVSSLKCYNANTNRITRIDSMGEISRRVSSSRRREMAFFN